MRAAAFVGAAHPPGGTAAGEAPMDARRLWRRLWSGSWRWWGGAGLAVGGLAWIAWSARAELSSPRGPSAGSPQILEVVPSEGTDGAPPWPATSAPQQDLDPQDVVPLLIGCQSASVPAAAGQVLQGEGHTAREFYALWEERFRGFARPAAPPRDPSELPSVLWESADWAELREGLDWEDGAELERELVARLRLSSGLDDPERRELLRDLAQRRPDLALCLE